MGCNSSRYMTREPERVIKMSYRYGDIPDKKLYMDDNDDTIIHKFNLREKQIFQEHGKKYLSSESKIDNIIPSRKHDAII